MIPRHLSVIIKKRLSLARSLYIFGARQVGKTTLLRETFPELIYRSLEDPDIEHHASQDPRGFLEQFDSKGGILDEVQRVPELFRYLQGFIDNNQGKLVLSGSQNFLLNQQISQSLAGRVSILELPPLSQRELWHLDSLDSTFCDEATAPSTDLETRLFLGGYPEPALKPEIADFWFADYERTYLERDVRLLVNVTNLQLFSQFIRLVANRVGSLLNIASLSNDLGLSENGCRKWLTILEASGVIFRLAPYYQNFNKRIVKSPKIYFNDTGLVCYLLGIKNSEQLRNHRSSGSVFENYVIAEIRKQIINQGKVPACYFWRDKAGVEIDLLIDDGSDLKAIEIKKGKTFTSDWLKAIKKWSVWAKQPMDHCHVVYGGNTPLVFDDVAVHSWQSI
jgi:hypothetical protein